MLIDEQKYKDALLHAHINSLKEAQNLKEIGYAQLVLVILYLQNAIAVDEIAKILAEQMLKIKNVPKSSVESALSLLKINNLVKNKNNKWSLTEEAGKNLDHMKKNCLFLHPERRVGLTMV